MIKEGPFTAAAGFVGNPATRNSDGVRTIGMIEPEFCCRAIALTWPTGKGNSLSSVNLELCRCGRKSQLFCHGIDERAPYRSIGSIFKRACRRANLIGVTPHTLRHTFASRLVMAGVDLRTVQELGGWQTLSMVERYAHLSPAHKAQAVERIALSAPSEEGRLLTYQ